MRIAAIFPLYWSLVIKSGGLHIIYLKVKSRCAQISNQILGLNTEAKQTDSKCVIKTVIEFLNFKKLETKGEVSFITIFNH